MTSAEIRDVQHGLLVFIPGLPPRSRNRPSWDELVRRLRRDLAPNWRVEVFEHNLTATSRVDLDSVVRTLAAQIREWAGELSEDVEPPDSILIAGHSFGGVLARAAYLLDAADATAPTDTSAGPDGSPAAFGRDATSAVKGDPRTDVDDADERAPAHRWPSLVRRIVLLGSPNSGYRKEAPGNPLTWRIAYELATPFADFTIEKVQAGGYWITDLRLRWLDAFQPGTGAARPKVVQVLGTADSLVTHSDILDQRFMPGAQVYEIPGADHAGLIRLDTARDPERRYEQLRTAIVGRDDETTLTATPPADGPTVFILHGIRAAALRTWVQKLGTEVASRSPKATIISPDTGYFTALEFALPGTRRRKVHEFLRIYGDAYASRDPNQFRFAGHSNGTYMMAQSLERVPSMRFDTIYLAGTVLPRRFDWDRLFRNRQVGSRGGTGWQDGRVRSDRGVTDVPVGLLCSWLRGLGSVDVGTAGLSGFENTAPWAIDETRTVKGGHGAPLAIDDQLGRVAEFLVTGTSPKPYEAESDGPPREWKETVDPSAPFDWLSRFVGLPPVAWGTLVGIGALGATGLVRLGRAKGARVAVGTGVGTVTAVWALLRSV
ncbi:alpha/beta hydrolase [Agromyces sp. PvR057]|uniref:alpha/beta fold hydrolase n=1 Tax=Agromyces sp. PvR057 TaxID=3156403 RepID=UPI000E274895